MSTLRELVVSIDFDGFDLRKLNQTEEAVDEIEDALRKMGNEIDDATRSFMEMGFVAPPVLNRIEDEANDATRALDRMGDRFKSFGKKMGGIGIKGGAFAGVFAGSIAATGPAIAAIGAIGASFGAAGIAAVGFGAVATSALGKVFDAADEVASLEEEIANADTAEERVAAYKELAAVYSDMSKEQRDALKDLNAFKDSWEGFVSNFEDEVFESFGNTLQFLDKLLTKMEPTIQNVADVMAELTDSLTKQLDSPDMVAFFEWLETNGADSIRTFAETAGNFFAGFLNLLTAFDPLAEDTQQGLLGMSERFREWTADLENNKSFQSFIEYAKVNGPIFMDILSDIWDLAVNLTSAFAGLGSSVLQALNTITNFIDESPIINGVLGGLKSVGNWMSRNTGVLSFNPGPYKADGSHADGLAEVKKDGYKALLHRGESVLTANQSNALKGAGILGSRGDRPTVNLGGGGVTFAPVVTVNAPGATAADSNVIGQEVRRELERFWSQMMLKYS